MIEKEIGELRRRLRPQKNNVNHIYGCYVSDNGEIITKFDESTTLMPEDELEKYLALFRRTLSGGLGRNLIDICFETKQVAEGAEHKLLMQLRETKLKDEALLDTFYKKVIDTVTMDTNYAILLLCDTYDVPFRGRDGAGLDDASDTQFTYLQCAVCPVKLTKSVLSYHLDEKGFHNSPTSWVVAAPELGFLFPAFDERKTNLYNALFYTHNLMESHEEFLDAVFKTPAPMPAGAQKETFQGLLSATLADDCNFEVVQSVHGQLAELIETHKESKDPEPLLLSKSQMQSVLVACGVSDAHAESFARQFEAEYGENTDISPRNIVDTKHFEVKTPDVTIQVSPDRADLIETRIIGGRKYVMIAAEEGVEVNGVTIQLPEE